MSFRKIWMVLFPSILKKGIYFSKYFEKYPLLRAQRRPEGAAGGGARGIFSNYLENRPLFSKYLEKGPIHIFLNYTFHFFFQIPVTIIYKGTQVTMSSPPPPVDSGKASLFRFLHPLSRKSKGLASI